MQSTKKDFSIKESFKFGFKKTFEHIGLFLGVNVLNFLPWLLIAGVIGFKTTKLLVTMQNIPTTELTQLIKQNFNYHWPSVLIYLLLFFAISGLFNLGSIKIALDVYDKNKASLRDMFSMWPRVISQIGALILYLLLVIGGFILLVVPGIYFMIKYGFSMTVIADKNVGPLDAFKMSSKLTQGVKLKLFLVAIISQIISSIAAITWVGLLIVWPVILLTNVYIYRSLEKQSGLL